MIRSKNAILKGYRKISAVWFPKYNCNEKKLQSSVIGLWTLNSKIVEFDDGYLFQFYQPRFLNCSELSGVALERKDQVLVSAEIDSSLIDKTADMVLLHENKLVSYHLANAKKVDVAQWIDLHAYTLAEPDDLPIVETLRLNPNTPAKSTRDIFGSNIVGSSQERDKFMSALTGSRLQTGNTASKPTNQGHFFSGIAKALKSSLNIFSSGNQNSSSDVIPPRQSRQTQNQNWRSWLAHLAIFTKASSIIGWRQAAYLKKMMDKFESGDLREALRHAIPLGRDDDSLGQAFGTFGPRHDLSITRRTANGASINFGMEVENHLKEMYRRAFNHLDRQGRIDEAAFVLADLLREKQEALDYLVKHDRLQTATELALAWDMPSSTIVRLCCLAGKWDMAMQVARRDQAFSASILLLQKDKPELANKLRYDWAEFLLQQGDFLTAVDVIWPIKDARELAFDWLKQAERSYGDLSIRASIQLILRGPEEVSSHSEKILGSLLDPDNNEIRLSIATIILALNEKHKIISFLSTKLIPLLIIDSYKFNSISSKQFTKLRNIAANKLLDIDLPDFNITNKQLIQPLANIGHSTRLQAPAAGLHAIYDLALLSNNRFLVALGESGLLVLNENMSVQSRYAIPCHQIILADSGQIALALVKRDSIWRIVRINLVTQEKLDLGALKLDNFASSFDGVSWSVVMNNSLIVIDTTNSTLSTLWSLSDLDGKIIEIARSRQYESLLIVCESTIQLMQYALPTRRLMKKDIIQRSDIEDKQIVLSANSRLSIQLEQARDKLHIRYNLWNKNYSLDFETRTPALGYQLYVSSSILVLGLEFSETVEWIVMNANTQVIIYRIEWPLTQGMRCINTETHWLFFDGKGRIATVNIHTGQYYSASFK